MEEVLEDITAYPRDAALLDRAVRTNYDFWRGLVPWALTACTIARRIFRSETRFAGPIPGEGRMRHFRPSIWCCWTLMLTATACVPMTVATTAQPVPQGETAPVLIWYSITNGINVMRDSGTT